MGQQLVQGRDAFNIEEHQLHRVRAYHDISAIICTSHQFFLCAFALISDLFLEDLFLLFQRFFGCFAQAHIGVSYLLDLRGVIIRVIGTVEP